MSFQDSGESAASGADETWQGLSLGQQAALEMAPKAADSPPTSNGVDWRDVAGKIWNAPNTALGLAYGGLGMAAGEVGHLLGRQDQPSVRWRDNSLQFVNNPLGGVSAITLGNTTTYRGDPYDPNDQYWYRKDRYPNGVDVNTVDDGHSSGAHEEAHTWQGQQLGPLYLPSNILGGLNALIHGEDWHGPHNWNEVGPQMNPPRAWPGSSQ